jgi:branched-chain amino acid transport system permease protein
MSKKIFSINRKIVFFVIMVSLVAISMTSFLSFNSAEKILRENTQDLLIGEASIRGEAIVDLLNSQLVFGIGMALAGASGSVMSFLFSFYPSTHWEFVAILLSLVVLGGMGSLLGALIGALTLSVVAAFVSANFGPTWSPATFYLALFLILMLRPQGLLGKKPELLRWRTHKPPRRSRPPEGRAAEGRSSRR